MEPFASTPMVKLERRGPLLFDGKDSVLSLRQAISPASVQTVRAIAAKRDKRSMLAHFWNLVHFLFIP